MQEQNENTVRDPAGPTQLMFTSEGEVATTAKGLTPAMQRRYGAAMAEIDRRRQLRAVCPWCLYIGTLDQFTKLTKAKEVSKNIECPKCNAGMEAKTAFIVDELGPEGYSRWFWDQIFSWHGFKKAQWDDIKAAAKAMGFLSTWWNVYHEFKNRKEEGRTSYMGSRASWDESVKEYMREKNAKKDEDSRDRDIRGWVG